MAPPDLIEWITIMCCFVVSGFLSCTETSVTSLDPLKVKHILASRGERARSLRLWADHPERVLVTILIFNNLVNTLASALATNITIKLFQNHAIAIATGIMTFIILVFCEIIPKSFGKTHAEPVAIVAMRVIHLLYHLSYPLVKLLAGLAQVVIRYFSGGRIINHDVTAEQLEFLVGEGQRVGVLKGMKKDIIEGAFEFDETRASEIITPRTSMRCLRENASFEQAFNLAVETGYSRIPIYKDSLDQITGIVLLKDLMAASNQAVKNSSIQVKDIMRKAFFAPESKTIMRLFVDLKRTKNHLAIIIDEYGGTLGLVTMEDILEEIFGEIQDEHDEEAPNFTKLTDHSWEVSGGVALDDFAEQFQLETFEHDADTLAGWITDMTKEMPQIGQTVEYKNLTIEITEVAQRRVLRTKVQITPLSTEATGTTNSSDDPAQAGTDPQTTIT